MIRCLGLLLLLTSFSSASIEKDKQLHLGYSVTISTAVTLLTGNYKVGLSSCVILGVAKEVYDEVSYGGFDYKDLAYDVVGCSVGAYISYRYLSHSRVSVANVGEQFSVKYTYVF